MHVLGGRVVQVAVAVVCVIVVQVVVLGRVADADVTARGLVATQHHLRAVTGQASRTVSVLTVSSQSDLSTQLGHAAVGWRDGGGVHPVLCVMMIETPMKGR